jgi:hypothetical protein
MVSSPAKITENRKMIKNEAAICRMMVRTNPILRKINLDVLMLHHLWYG